MAAPARLGAVDNQGDGGRRIKLTLVLALALHLGMGLASAWAPPDRRTWLRPLAAAEIALHVEHVEHAEPAGSAEPESVAAPTGRPERSARAQASTRRARPVETERVAAPEPPKPVRPAAPSAVAPSSVAPSADRPLQAEEPPTTPSPGSPPWSPPNGQMPVPSNSRARQLTATAAGHGTGQDGGGLFGNGRFMGYGPGALEARVCFIPETTRSVDEFSGCEIVHREFMEVIDVPSRRFEEGFPGFPDRTEWFAVTIVGTFTVSEPGPYKFRLKSDDGSQLFIDGKLVVDNDGIHDAISRRGRIELERGRHRILLKYFQGMKFVLALQLFVTPPGQPERLFSSVL